MKRSFRKSLIRRARRWLHRRSWDRFKYCLPALTAGAVSVVLVTVVSCFHESTAAMRYRYLSLVHSSLSAGQFEVARVACLRGLAGEKNERAVPEWLFYLAAAMNGLGHKPEAADLLAAAAPLDAPGFPQAQLLAAQTLLNSTNLTVERLQLAEKHLQNVIAEDPCSLAANELLGCLYLDSGKPAKARERWRTIYPVKPDTALLIAISYDQERDADAAISWANRAITAIRSRLVYAAPDASAADRVNLVHALLIKGRYAPLTDPIERALLATTPGAVQDSPPIWLYLVRDLKPAEKYAAALETLQRANRHSPSSLYPPAIADICAAWAGKISPQQDAKRLELIETGLDCAPQNLRLRWLLLQATHAPPDASEQAKTKMEKLLATAEGESAAWWYFLLWTDARVRGNLPTARGYLKKAFELAPQIPQIQNDLAMDLATGNQQDLKHALNLIQSVIEKHPENRGFRDTQEHIKALLARNQ